jgi:hypothetical protein
MQEEMGHSLGSLDLNPSCRLLKVTISGDAPKTERCVRQSQLFEKPADQKEFRQNVDNLLVQLVQCLNV